MSVSPRFSYGRYWLPAVLLSSGLSGVVSSVWMIVRFGGGRISDTGIYWCLPTFFLYVFQVEPGAWLPATPDPYWELSGWGAGFEYTLLAVLTNLSLSGVLTAALFFLTLATRVTGPQALKKGALSPALSSLIILVALLAPGLLRPVFDIFRENWPWDHFIRWGTFFTLTGLVSAALILHRRLRGAALGTFFFRSAVVMLALLVTLSLGAFASMLTRGQPRPFPPQGTPNILVVSIDTLRADHLHCYGYRRQTSPNLDELARQGVLFQTAVAPAPWTLPSHITLLTGLPPSVHRVDDDGMRLSRKALTLAEVLANAGFVTAGFVGGAYLRAEYGFRQGFDQYEDYTVAPRNQGATSPALVRLLHSWLDDWSRQPRRRPFFVFFHLWDVHSDYDPPPPYDTLFDPDYDGEITGVDVSHSPRVHRNMDRRDLEHLIALYDGEIRFTDQALGRVFQILKSLAVYDETIVVVTSDHGEEFFEHGNKEHRKSLYDESVRVPLIMRYPEKIPAGRIVSAQVRLMDVAPTLLGLADVKLPVDFGYSAARGPHSFMDLLPLVLESAGGGENPISAFSRLHQNLLSLRSEHWKAIRHLDDGATELYDLSDDPLEQVNLSGQGLHVESMLMQELTKWATLDPRVRLDEPFLPDEQQLQRLRGLGYVN